MAMMQLVCADAGTVCPAVLSAHSQDELIRQLAHHLSREHGVPAPTKTILNYMASLAREGVAP
jgi:predicted small metal-binding protein